MNEDTEMRICTSKPFCLCVGEVNEWDECSCTGNIRGCSTERCEACGAPLEVINIETGATVVPAKLLLDFSGGSDHGGDYC